MEITKDLTKTLICAGIVIVLIIAACLIYAASIVVFAGIAAFVAWNMWEWAEIIYNENFKK